jgi:hypothetical protein
MKIKKKGFVVLKKIFTKKEINQIERDIIFFISNYLKNYSKKLSKEGFNILKKKSFQKESIIFFEKIENYNKEIFYRVCKDAGNFFTITNCDQKAKIINFLKNYFKKNYFLIQKKNPIILFNKKNLNRLQYQWHQESQYYPEHELGLHLWFPIFRDVKKDNDGSLKFAISSNKINYSYRQIIKKNSWIQRIPKINVEKIFKTQSISIKRGDVAFFENKVLHKSDNQENTIPRISVVVRYLSTNEKNKLHIF